MNSLSNPLLLILTAILGTQSMAGGNQRDAGGYWWMVEMVKDQKEPTVEIETDPCCEFLK